MFVHSANISLGFWMVQKLLGRRGRHDRQGAHLCVTFYFVNFRVFFPILINILIFSPRQRLREEDPESKNSEGAKLQMASKSKDEFGKSNADHLWITALCSKCLCPGQCCGVGTWSRMGIAGRSLTSCPGAESNGALFLPILPVSPERRTVQGYVPSPRIWRVFF